MKHAYQIVLFGSIPFLLFCSCNQGPLKPAGFPRLYPCTILVENDGAPAKDVLILFRSADPSVKWSIGGTTDSDGFLKVTTHGMHLGVPEGEYKIICSKQEEEQSKYPKAPPEDSPEYDKWKEKVSKEKLSVYTLIDPIYEKTETTPLSASVKKGQKNEFQFNLGKSIRLRMK